MADTALAAASCRGPRQALDLARVSDDHGFPAAWPRCDLTRFSLVARRFRYLTSLWLAGLEKNCGEPPQEGDERPAVLVPARDGLRWAGKPKMISKRSSNRGRGGGAAGRPRVSDAAGAGAGAWTSGRSPRRGAAGPPLRMASIIDKEARGPPRPGLPLAPGASAFFAGGAEAGSGSLVQAGVRRLVARHGGERGPPVPVSALDRRRLWDVVRRGAARRAGAQGWRRWRWRRAPGSRLDTSSVTWWTWHRALQRSSDPATPGRGSRSGARPTRSDRIRGWPGWGWWSPATAPSSR